MIKNQGQGSYPKNHHNKPIGQNYTRSRSINLHACEINENEFLK